jgi:hypothetical protein
LIACPSFCNIFNVTAEIGETGEGIGVIIILRGVGVGVGLRRTGAGVIIGGKTGVLMAAGTV